VRTFGTGWVSLFGGFGVLLVLGCAPDPAQGSATKRGPKPYGPAIVPLNAEVSREARVDALRPGGASGYALTGAGVLVAEWDEGAVRDTHRDLLGRVTIRDRSGLSDHASHAAATIVGSGTGDPSAIGMAPGAELYSYSWGLDLVEMAGIGPFVSASSHAYGEALGWQANPACSNAWSWAGEPSERRDGRFGRYGVVAAALDRVVREADLLSVWAAGNDRDDGPTTTGVPHAHFPSCDEDFSDDHLTEAELEYDTLGGAAVAKNVLTVGAIRDLPESWTSGSIVPHAASSFGPTDDGRVKPDLVAGGDGVRSASAVADDAYSSRSGTSSAAAAVTGIAALLVEHYRDGREGRDPRASELKAVLVQTAQDAGMRGPDYRTGHGLVDASAAGDFLDADRRNARLRVDVATGPPNELVTDSVPEGTALRVTVAWLDPPGPPRVEPDATPVLENDLDLSLVAPDGRTIFHPWSLDRERPEAAASQNGPNRVDNVEVVDVDAADNTFSGAWTLRVETPNGLFRGVPQPYAVAASVPIDAPPRPIAGSATRLELPVVRNDSATLSIPIENLGGGTLDWTASTEAPFLTLEKASGSAGEALVVSATGTSSLSPRFAAVTLESSDPGGPRTLGVRLETTCIPDCTGRECGPDPTCASPCGRCPPESACGPDGLCVEANDGCPAADLGSALGSGLVSGATSGSSLRFGSCGGERSPDTGFSWSAPRAGRYAFSTEGSGFDTILSLRRGGCEGSEIACNDDALDLSSSLVVELEADESVTAMIDGFDGAAGPFLLGIHEVSCPDGELGSLLGQNVLAEVSPGHLDRMQASCAEGAAREAALAFTAPVDGAYGFDASGSNFESFVAVLRNDCQGDELACMPESAEVSLVAGQRVVVVIDGAITPDDRFALVVTTRNLTCDGDCRAEPGGGLCACDERCVVLGDCCVDACGDCANCAPDQDCEFGRCIPRRCASGDCGCSPATGGTGMVGCDAGAGGVPGDAGAPATEEPVQAVEGSGCVCTSVAPSRANRLAWLGIALGLALLASRRGRI
jgi:hypothetical protein